MDAGVKERFVLSDGTKIAKRVHDRRVIKRHQRAVSRATRGSASRRKKVALLARAHARQAEGRRDEDFRAIARLMAGGYDGFAVEALQIRNMVRNKHLSDSISQQGWGAFTTRLQHKAERAGLPFVRVHPAYTSQTCSCCGHRLQGDDRLGLADRVFKCPVCGLRMDRDVNAAVIICDCAFGHRPRRARPGGNLPVCAAGPALPAGPPTALPSAGLSDIRPATAPVAAGGLSAQNSIHCPAPGGVLSTTSA